MAQDTGRLQSGFKKAAALPIEIGVQLWKSVFRHGLPLTDKIATRTALTNYWLHAHPPRIRKSHMKFSYTFCLGGISFFLFVLLTVTGLFLMFYYVPSVQYAYQNMKDLQYAVSFGIVMRNLHRWGAHAMVITVWLHMCRVFYTGSYKPPREFNWGIGVTLLLMTLLLSFTGYLLPWDQLSLWAVTVGTNMAKYAPRGGPADAVLDAGVFHRRQRHHPALLRRPRPGPSAGCLDRDDDSLLESPKGRLQRQPLGWRRPDG